VSVFLRWGVFGILGFAALWYAYNASKQMAEKRAARAPPVTATAVAPVPAQELAQEQSATPAAMPLAVLTASPACEVELLVAQRALEARRQGEPLDRLLRIQEIAFEEGTRRARLEKVATLWYRLEGDEPIAETLRIAVVSDCVRSSPMPAP
jgi:hypothetical protein